MKKLLPLLTLLVFVAAGLWAQFYTTLPRDVRKNLAEAYYLVGRQYEQKGDTQKARDFQDMAYNIDPGLDPANIQIQDLRSAAALILEGKAKLAAVPRTRDGLAPSEVYDLNSLGVTPVTTPWGETYAIQIRAKMDFSKQVAFWSTQQKYLMHQSAGRWLLFSVGQKLPPANWRPKPAPRFTPQAASGLESGPQPEIKAALLACLDAFMDKDVDSASRYFANEVTIIRLNTTLSRREIAETFQGYFDDADFSSVSGEDIVDPKSIFVSPSDRFPDQSRG